MSSQMQTLPTEVARAILWQVVVSNPCPKTDCMPDYRSLINMAQLCSLWRRAAADAQLWKTVCDYYQAPMAEIDETCNTAIHFQNSFRNHFIQTCLSSHSNLLAFTKIKSNAKRLLSKYPGQKLLRPLDLPSLPTHLHYLLTIANGQKIYRNPRENSLGLFGSCVVYGSLYSMYWAPVESVSLPSSVKILCFGWATMEEYLGYVTEKGSSNLIEGSIIRFGEREGFNRMGPVPADTIPYITIAPSLEIWLDTFTNGSLMETKWSSPSIFRTNGMGTSTAVTNGIKIDVSSYYLFTSAQYVYQVTMTRTSDCPYTRVQLTTRRWVFERRNGTNLHVEGEGVIGEFPILEEGDQRESFRYCSLSGGGQAHDEMSDFISMEGGFTFQIEDSDLTFEAKVEKVCFLPPSFLDK